MYSFFETIGVMDATDICFMSLQYIYIVSVYLQMKPETQCIQSLNTLLMTQPLILWKHNCDATVNLMDGQLI